MEYDSFLFERLFFLFSVDFGIYLTDLLADLAGLGDLSTEAGLDGSFLTALDGILSSIMFSFAFDLEL